MTEYKTISMSESMKNKMDLIKALGKYTSFEDILKDNWESILDMAMERHAEYNDFRISVTVGEAVAIENDTPTVFEKSMRSEVE